MAKSRALCWSPCHCLYARLQNVVRAAAQCLLVLHLQLCQNGQLPWGECLKIGLGVLRRVSWQRCLWLCGRSLWRRWHHSGCWAGLLLHPVDGLQRGDMKRVGRWVGQWRCQWHDWRGKRLRGAVGANVGWVMIGLSCGVVGCANGCIWSGWGFPMRVKKLS